MNIHTINNKLWESQDNNQHNVTEIALYFYLMNVANRGCWANSFQRLNARIMLDLGVSSKTLSKARNGLKQSGLIDFKTTKGSKYTTYTFGRLPDILSNISDNTLQTSGNFPEVLGEVEDDTQQTSGNFPKVLVEVENDTSQTSGKFPKVLAEVENHTLYSNKHKTILCIPLQGNENQEINLDSLVENKTPTVPPNDPETKEEKVASKEEKLNSILAELSPEWRVIVSDWLVYKKERRESYKTGRSVECFISLLQKLSSGDAKQALQIIEQSMAGNYQGIFPLKIEQYAYGKRINRTNRIGEYSGDFSADQNF